MTDPTVSAASPRKFKIVGFATQGSGGDDELRLRALLEQCENDLLPFDRAQKLKIFYALFRKLVSSRPDLAVMEGTGLAGGAALLLAKALTGQRYVVSSGDAVGPFIGAKYPSLGPLFLLYEKLLYRHAAGFVGWSPYMTGRALTFGTPKAMTAAGWAPFTLARAEQAVARAEVRKNLGISDTALVVGICGSLAWNSRVNYCYGYELVRALRGVTAPELQVLIVGDGAGRSKIEQEIPSAWRSRVHLTGRVPRDSVPKYLAAMDAASLPQSVDQVGSFRYTTKLSEYLAARLPVITGQIPLSYDLPGEWLWRLSGDYPWGDRYQASLGRLLGTLSHTDVLSKRDQIPELLPEFDVQRQVARFTDFVNDLLGRSSVAR
jgi:hypothetical protein